MLTPCRKPSSYTVADAKLKKELEDALVASESGTANDLTLTGEVKLDPEAVSSIKTALGENPDNGITLKSLGGVDLFTAHELNN